MLAKRLEIANGVAARLFAAENAIDLAATRLAELTAAMPQARIEGRMSALIGQDAFAASADALALLARVRERIVDAHRGLKGASEDIGLGEVGFGDSVKPPSTAQSKPGSGLRIAS